MRLLPSLLRRVYRALNPDPDAFVAMRLEHPEGGTWHIRDAVLTLQAFGGVHYGTREGEFRLGFDIPAQTVLRADGMTCDIIPAFTQQPVIFDMGVALRVKI